MASDYRLAAALSTPSSGQQRIGSRLYGGDVDSFSRINDPEAGLDLFQGLCRQWRYSLGDPPYLVHAAITQGRIAASRQAVRALAQAPSALHGRSSKKSLDPMMPRSSY
jgi:hypothetical protein